MYSRVKKANKSITYISLSLGLILINVLAVLFFLPNSKIGAKTLSTRAEAEVIKTTSSEPKASSTSSSSSSATPSETVSTPSTSTVASTEAETVVAEPVTEVASEQVAYTTETANYQASYASYQPATATSTYTTTATLSNGNTAGQIGTEAAAQMAAATGVPQSTWEHIIARESNGNPNVANASGASGLFQTMPGWGSTATVQDQVNTAIKVYNTQGMSAWGY